MARHVFFSFDFKGDSHRVAQVRNSWVIGDNGEANPLLDHAEWEKVERQGDGAIKRWIDDQMHGASVTVVLIGAGTYTRRWVKYEIQQSHMNGKGLLGVSLTGVKDLNQIYGAAGPDPIAACDLRDRYGNKVYYPVYNWVAGNGRQNLSSWVEEAANKAGR